jgi:trans-2,3-dihydro-3-hydroxyanthranilate isomerase
MFWRRIRSIIFMTARGKSVREFAFRTVDVFTNQRFGGNPLAVFPDARGLSARDMQALAAEMNLSETTFVLPPSDPSNTARVRIFNRTAEMPFAGHPNVGTAFVLACLRPELGDTLRFEELAGLVEVRVERGDDGAPVGAEIDAPQPLRTLGVLDPSDVARCVGLEASSVRLDTHPPVRATVGVEFALAELAPAALSNAAPDLAAFRRVAAANGVSDRFSLFVYCRAGNQIRARMFAPLSGTFEDAATGSANATLGALLLERLGGSSLSFEAIQGAEMGRPSFLRVTARRGSDGVRASVGGGCVDVLAGTAAC